MDMECKYLMSRNTNGYHFILPLKLDNDFYKGHSLLSGPMNSPNHYWNEKWCTTYISASLVGDNSEDATHCIIFLDMMCPLFPDVFIQEIYIQNHVFLLHAHFSQTDMSGKTIFRITSSFYVSTFPRLTHPGNLYIESSLLDMCLHTFPRLTCLGNLYLESCLPVKHLHTVSQSLVSTISLLPSGMLLISSEQSAGQTALIRTQ